jgi:aminoglycoside phosphotransferase (APT) family kinase protein
VTAISPTPAQCEAVLRAAGIDEPLTRVERVPVADYSPNIVCFLNDRYVVRMTTADGEARLGRERAALDRLGDLPGVPRVLGAGTVPLDAPAHYLLQTRLPGRPVIAAWPGLTEPARRRLIGELAGMIRTIHMLPTEGYAVGFYQAALREWRGSWIEGHDAGFRQLLAGIRRRPLTEAQAALVDEAEAYYTGHRDALAYGVGPRMQHGDLHLHNVLARDGHVTGIVDWEWSFGGGVEPDFDVEALVRWSLFPADLGDEAEAATLRAEDFAGVIPALLAGYPELAAVPRLAERMTIYQIEHELYHMASWPPRVPTRPAERLASWLRNPTLLRALA